MLETSINLLSGGSTPYILLSMSVILSPCSSSSHHLAPSWNKYQGYKLPFPQGFSFFRGGGKLTAIFSTHTHKKTHHTLSHCIQVTGVYYELFARLNLSHLAPCFHQHCCLCEPQWHRRAWRQTLSVWTLSQPSRCDSSRFLCKYQHVSVLPFNMSGVFLDPPLCSKINIKQCICIFPDNYFKVFWKEYSKKVL